VHNTELKVHVLYETFKDRLHWHWGNSTGRECILHYSQDTILCQHLNPHRSAIVTLIGETELTHFEPTLPALNESQLWIICGDTPLPALWRNTIEKTNTPILFTVANSIEVQTLLTPYLFQHLNAQITLHGVFLDIFGKGVLLQGKPGVGKSECALALLNKGHRLIADDAPQFYAVGTDIVGFVPPKFSGLLEIRGLGVIDIHHHFGPLATVPCKSLELIIQLCSENEIAIDYRPLQIKLDSRDILGIPVRYLTLSLAFNKNMAILVESAVRLAFSPKSSKVQQLMNPFQTELEQCDL
jgi:HPr kinase/phosphorylase